MLFSLIWKTNDNFSIFTDNVRAIHDVWLLGETFLKEVIGALHSLHTAAKVKNTSLYLFQHFNVLDGQPSFSMTGLNRWLSPLVGMINEHKLLPKFLIVIQDKDILFNFKDQGMETALVIGSTLHYLIKQMDMIIDHQR